MKRVLVAMVAFAVSCGNVDPNGSWSAPDAGLVFYDWDGGLYWNGNNILLDHALIIFDEDCAMVRTVNDRLVFSGTSQPVAGTYPDGQGDLKLSFRFPDALVDEGYRIRHGSTGLSGLVRLSFDAGFYFKTDDQAAFRWQADYSDDARHLQTEGGELWFERSSSDCR